MSPFPFGKGLFSRSSKFSVYHCAPFTSLPYPPGKGLKHLQSAGPETETHAAFVAQGGHLGPQHQAQTVPLLLGALPAHRVCGVGWWEQRSAWPSLLARPPAEHRGPAAQRTRAAGSEGPERGPQMPPLPPFLGRGPHGVREQEESIRIMKPQPATHCGGTEESGPVPSPPDGSEEQSRHGPAAAGCSGGSEELVRRSRSPARRSSAQAPDNRALATGTPKRNLKAAEHPFLALTPGAQGKGVVSKRRGRWWKGVRHCASWDLRVRLIPSLVYLSNADRAYNPTCPSAG